MDNERFELMASFGTDTADTALQNLRGASDQVPVTPLHGDSSSSERLNTLIIRFAAVSAWIAAFALTSLAVFTGDQSALIQSMAAALAGSVFVGQLLARRLNGMITIGVGAVCVIGTIPIVEGETALSTVSLSLVMLAIVGSILVSRFQVVYLAATAVALALVPLLWNETFGGALIQGLNMSIWFLVASLAFQLVRRRTHTAGQLFRQLFERAPVGLVEQDWSDAVAMIDALQPTSPGHLRRILADQPDLLDQIVEQITIIRVNDKAAEIVGLPVAELLGRQLTQRVQPTNRDNWVDQVVGMWIGEPTDTMEYETVDYLGRPGLWLEVRTISIVSPGRHRVILAVTDITETRRMAVDLADRVREKDDFIATVSHELRTPLTAVVGLGNELLASDDLSQDERRELLELVVSQARDITHLVEDLLVGARADAGTITISSEPIDLRQEAQTVVSTTDTALRIEAPSEYPPALGDPVRVRQIIRNLAVNADRYGGPSRRVVIKAEVDTVLLEVRDTGTPLEEEDRVRIFEPYTRAHDRPGVTVSVGLGLSVSRRLARMMGGDLVYDHDGWECIFRLILPVDADDRSPTKVEAGRV